MASGTAGNLITYDASGNPAAVATGTATHVLTSNGAGAAPTFQEAPVGGIVPSVAIKTDTETLSTSAFTDVTGLSIAFTASSITQKITVRASVCFGNATTCGIFFRLVNEDGALTQGSAAGSRTQCHAYGYATLATVMQSATMEVLFTPGTVSERTYKLQWYRGGTGSCYINRTATDTDSAPFPRTVSTLILQPH
jgi:hypothetical protein